MHWQYNGSAIRLRQNSRLSSKGYQVTGMLVLLCCLLGLTRPPKGEVIELFFPGVALLSFALAKLAERSNERDFAVLYPDRFEDPGLGGTNRVVHWNKVESLRWISNSEKLAVKTREVDTPLGFFTMNMEDLNPEDRLTFIRYVRHAAKRVPQERWPSFCHRVAVPLAQQLDRRAQDDGSANEQPRTLHEAVITGGMAYFASHPFLAGLMMPFYFLLTLPLLVSRKMSWTLAAIVAASGAINIRLVWGAWINPFTVIAFSTAVFFFVLGFFSRPRDVESLKTRGLRGTLLILVYLSVLLIGVPFAANALAKGWLPRGMALLFRWLAPVLLLMPVILIPLIQAKQDKRSSDEIESEAQAIWDAVERRICNEHAKGH